MRTIVKGDLLILAPDTASEVAALVRWRNGRDGHVLALQTNSNHGAALRFLGPREVVCREPIRVSNRHPDPAIRLIGNLAPTPFVLDDAPFASVESFWHALKFPAGPERDRIAAHDGHAARQAGESRGSVAHIDYGGRAICAGRAEHWHLLELACRAKFAAHEAARTALLETGERPLHYRVRNGCPLLPGAVVADIWMRIRSDLQSTDQASTPDEIEE